MPPSVSPTSLLYLREEVRRVVRGKEDANAMGRRDDGRACVISETLGRF